MPDEKMTNEIPSDDDITLTEEEKQFTEFAADVDREDEDEEFTLEAKEEEETEVTKPKDEPKPAEEPKAEEPPEPEPEPVAEPEAKEPEPEPSPEPAAVKQPEPEPEPKTTEPPAPSDEELKQQREQFEATLERELYQMSDEENDAMLLEPKKVLPKLAARVHAEVLDATVKGVLSHIPRMVQMEMTRAKQRNEIQAEFYEQWPKLVGQEQTVTRVAQMYGQLNPTASQEQTIKDIGVQAMLMLGLSLDETPAQTPAPAQVRTPMPAAPAAPGGATGMVPNPAPSSNEYVRMAEEFLDDDSG